ncbi:non-ribosomal peptide synthetase/type I polyketide synthase [Fulvivirga sediminis]|uniref:Amino acid adenylation domain-containing protein n=1 Tax=Fulvivirga sediminis TaxID=2803949 RepID=A0A937JZL2_9BACT|nr:non-ribosomal peptide synthetase/type I polyketide synthase [Fulvivirga sediminis]MBL3657518.1 amino acid adenylation domain-containing protein [Fulvivirga sediminis]
MSFNSIAELVMHKRSTSSNEVVFKYLENGEQVTHSLTYEEIDTKAREIASYLQHHNFKGQRALLLFASGTDFIVSFLGCLYAKVIAVPIYPPRNNKSIKRLESVISDAEAKIVICSSETHSSIKRRFNEVVNNREVKFLIIDQFQYSGKDYTNENYLPDDLAFLQYTSGSTGNPKGVMVSHGNIIANTSYMHKQLAISQDDVIVSWLPVFHDMGLIIGICLPLFSGITCCLIPPVFFLAKPYRWLKAISDFKGTITPAPNFAYQLCSDKISEDQQKTLDLSSLKAAINGAEPVRYDVVHEFIETFAPQGLRTEAICPGYGMAEATLAISISDFDQKFKSIYVSQAALTADNRIEVIEGGEICLIGNGQIPEGSDVFIVNPDTLKKCEANEIGEVWLKNDSVAQGYWRNQEETKHTFHAYIKGTGEGPFLRTGDLGFVKENELYITGRHKDLIIIRGQNIYPQDVEYTVEKCHPDLKPASGAAFSTLSDDGDEVLVIIQELERTSLQNFNKDEIIKHIRSAVAVNHDIQVGVIILLKTLGVPKTSSGKIQRRACKKAFIEDSLEVMAQWHNPDLSFKKKAEVKSSDDKMKQPNKEPFASSTRAITEKIMALVYEKLDVPPSSIDSTTVFSQLGMDSLKLVQLSQEVGDMVGEKLHPELLYEYPTIGDLSNYLTKDHSSDIAVRSKVDKAEGKQKAEPIAIIGMACRFPGAHNLKEYEQLLRYGKDGVGPLSYERHELYPQGLKDENFEGGYLDEVDGFDAGFFKISPADARSMDPQQRLLMEVAWETIENAGLTEEDLRGSAAGVFIGASGNDYWKNLSVSDNRLSYTTGVGNAFSILANRISYFFDFKGPSIVVDTACSSSLVAVHQACESLRRNESSMAFAGGVNLILNNDINEVFTDAQMLSPDNRCKTYDTEANGYVRGEGCGIVVLKRLADAIKDNDDIKAIIRGSAINQDGKSNGITAPNGAAQREVIMKACHNAQISPSDIGYVEMHGTGTPLGDPIEYNALLSVMKTTNRREEPCYVGSVKSQIGHLEPAAGIAGLIKAVLILKNNFLPKQLHFNSINPKINDDSEFLQIVTELRPWKKNGRSRCVGISSFGFGGTNSHLIVEDVEVPSQELPQVKSLTFNVTKASAKSPKALRDIANNYKDFIRSNDSIQWQAIAQNINTSRSDLPYRATFVASNKEELLTQLGAFADEQRGLSGTYYSDKASATLPQVTFLFTGQGSQYSGMGKELYKSHSFFRKLMDRCDSLLRPYLHRSALEILFNDDPLVNQTQYAQPLIFMIEYCLAELWLSWGVRPQYVLGHSIGEYTAACVAGIFSLEDALRLVAKRGELMQQLPVDGDMLAVFTTKDKITPLILDKELVAIAAENTDQQFVLSGSKEQLVEISDTLIKQGVTVQYLQVSHAFHSPLMAPMLSDFKKELEKTSFHQPTIDIISNLTGKSASQELLQPNYWCEHILQTVRFKDSIDNLLKQNTSNIFLEVGPGRTLTAMGQSIALNVDGDNVWLSSIRKNRDEWKTMLDSLSLMYINGCKVNWKEIIPMPVTRIEGTPTYPFQREKLWIKTNVHKKQDVLSDQFINEVPKQSTQEVSMVILAELKRMVSEPMEIEPDAIEEDSMLLELGMDSLVMMSLLQKINKRYHVKLQINQLFEYQNTLKKLAIYIDENIPQTIKDQYVKSHAHVNPAVEPILETENKEGEASDIKVLAASRGKEHLFEKQLALLEKNNVLLQDTLKRQIEALSSSSTYSASTSEVNYEKRQKKESSIPPANAKEIMLNEPRQLTDKQQVFLDQLVAKFTSRTAGSKLYAQESRAVLADWINSIDFRMLLKEMQYPIVSVSSKGGEFKDIDGNEYVDVALGYGVNFFGNTPLFIKKAVSDQLHEGIELASQFDKVSELAQRISAITGQERITFCNTGTEAVMAAVRIARAKHNKQKLVVFQGFYHGTFDGNLAQPGTSEDNERSFPIAPGTPLGMVEDTIVLPYDSEDSIRYIEEHAAEIAAVLIEPVQSRRPGIFPISFLRQLRQVTQKNKVALIFDEIITGFRIAPGGAQQLLDFKSDITTYGKVIGGGMPIGVVAGKKEYMDVIDGGSWSYGDDSYPSVPMTFFGGTFCKHPLAMAAALAVTEKIIEEGNAMYERVNRLTDYMAASLNAFFQNLSISIKIVNFGSLFRFEGSGKYSAMLRPIELEIFHKLLIYKGVYGWERKICFISTEHTLENIQSILVKVKEAIEEMIAGGFFPEATPEGPDHGNEVLIKGFDIAAQPLSTNGVSHGSNSTPLSSAQKQLWMLSAMSPEGAAAYNMIGAVTLKGNLDVHVLKKSLQQLVDRHEALRISIDKEGEFQTVINNVICELELMSLKGMATSIQQEAISMAKQEVASKVFDLSQPPLIRACLLALEDNHFELILVSHHIVSDGWSVSLLLEEWSKCYSAMVTNKPVILSKPGSFASYLKRRTEDAFSKEYEKSKQYLLEKFSGEMPVLNLPIHTNRPPQKTYAGARCTVVFSEKLNSTVKEVSKKQGVTPFMTLLSGFSILMHKLCSQNDLVIGIPTAGRNDEDDTCMVGYCANVVPIKSSLKGSYTIKQHVQAVRQELLESFQHEQFAFADLLNEMPQTRDKSRAPLAEVLFTVNPRVKIPSFEGLDSYFSQGDVAATAYDLSVDVTEINGELWIDCDYNTDLLTSDTLKKWMSFYSKILEGMSSENQSIAQMDWIGDDERRLVLQSFNEVSRQEVIMKNALPEVFEEQVTKTPDKIAIIYEEKTFTYQKLNEKANQWAHYLRNVLMVQSGDRVGVMVSRSEMMYVYFLGVLKAGATFLPIDPEYPPSRVDYIISDSGPKLLLTDQERGEILDAEGVACYDVKNLEEVVCNESVVNLPFANIQDQAAYIVYTSGSTGKPKGVEVAHQAIINMAYSWLKEYRLNTFEEHYLQLASIAWDVFVGDFCRGILSGGYMVICPQYIRMDIEGLYDLINTRKINIFESTPSLILPLMDYVFENGLDVSFMQLLIVGSDVFMMEDYRKLSERFGHQMRIINSYGTTEATVDSSYYEAVNGELPNVNYVPIGKPIANTRYYILDEHGMPCPTGVAGELYIAGPGLALGYLNNSELNRAHFLLDVIKGTRVYRSGDLAYWLQDGNVMMIGRNDSLVKVRGFRIELSEIENVLVEYSAIEHAVVIAVDDANGNKQLAAFYAGDNSRLDTAQVRAHLKHTLPAYMVPSYLLKMDTWPITRNGKVNRRALLEKLDSYTPEKTYKAPETELQKTLVSIWEEVLHLSPIGLEDDFFELGGHSLKLTQVASRIYQQLNYKTDLRKLFENTTILSLSHVLEAEILKSTESAGSIKRVEELEDYELSYGQKRLWILNKLEDQGTVYNMPGALLFKGELNLEALQNAYAQLFLRHEILRTVIIENYGEPRQKLIDKDVLKTFSFRDISSSPDPKDVADKLAKDFANEVFDIAVEHAIKVKILKLSEQEHVILITMHHIIADAWSIEVLIRDWFTAYDSLSKGLDYNPTPLAIQYKDYAVWHNRQLAGDRMEEAENFWLSLYSGDIPVLDMPTTYTRPAVKTYRGAALVKQFSVNERQQLKKFNRLYQVSGFTTLMAALYVLLHKYTHQADMIIGTPVSGREHVDLENQIGFFVNTLAIRTQIYDEENFAEVVKKVHNNLMEAYRFQAYPFDKLVENSKVERDLSRSALFDVMITMDNTSDVQSSLDQWSGFDLKLFETDTQVSKFDLCFDFTEGEQDLSLRLEYNTDLFSDEMALQLINHYHQLLMNMLQKPEEIVGHVSMLTTQEMYQLTTGCNMTDVPYPDGDTIVQMIEKSAERYPEATAIHYKQKQFSYKEINEKSNALAFELLDIGINKGDLIPLLMTKSVELPVAMLAVMKVGGVFVPFDTDWPQERIQLLLDTISPKVVLMDAVVGNQGITVKQPKICFYVESADSKEENPGIDISPDDLIYGFFTSGSTGLPKCAMNLHRGIRNRFMYMNNVYSGGNNERILFTSKHIFDAAVWQLFWPLTTGSQVIIPATSAALDFQEVAELIREYKVTITDFVPSVFALFVDYLKVNQQDVSGFKSLKYLLIGGEAMNSKIIRNFRAIFPEVSITNTYGPTETSIGTVFYHMWAAEEVPDAIPIGMPIDNVKALVLDKRHQPVPFGVVGELFLGGDCVGEGYFNDPEKTRKVFINNPFKNISGKSLYATGDLVIRRHDGNIMYLGRKDHQVKINGIRIELGEIEAILTRHEDVKQALAVVNSENGLHQLVVYFTGKVQGGLDALKDFCFKYLPKYMVPRHLIELDHFPLTPTGKIDRKALPQIEHNVSLANHYLAPVGEKEEALCEVLLGLLTAAVISRTDHFFHIGGDSIKAILLGSRLQTKGYRLKVQDVFLHPVIGDMALKMEPIKKVANQGEVVGEVLLTPIYHQLFEEIKPDTHHFNQSVWLKSNQRFEEDKLKRVWKALLEHHDSLRTYFIEKNKSWKGYVMPAKQADLILWKYDYRNITPADGLEQMAYEVERLQQSFDLSQYPLYKVALFRLPSHDQLLIAIHHTLVDGVSWRILIEDFGHLYSAFMSDDSATLPPKTDSYQLWASLLKENTDKLLSEVERTYWLDLVKNTTVPTLGIKTADSGLVSDASTLTLSLSKEKTLTLISEVHHKYNTEVSDILITALAMAVQQCFGAEKFVADFEGHGREELPVSVDVSRTMGWFTTVFPVAITLPESSLEKKLITVKEYMRKIPKKGFGYGIAKYLMADFSDITRAFKPVMLFNYLGQFDGDWEEKHFTVSTDNTGIQESPHNKRRYALEVTAEVINKKLSIQFNYTDKQIDHATIKLLGETWLNELDNLLQVCKYVDNSHLTPHDTHVNHLSIEELDELQKEFSLETIYPLSAMQKALFYNDKVSSTSLAYFEQTSFPIYGKVNPKHFQKAFNELMLRHEILRAAFVETTVGPLQLILKNREVKFYYDDISASESSEKVNKISRIKETDKEVPFDLSQEPLVRVYLLKIEDEKYEFIWSHHHIIIDGWCVGIIFSELFRIYYGLCESKPIQLLPAPSYAHYQDWLNTRNKDRARAYWKELLSGYSSLAEITSQSTFLKDEYENEVIQLGLNQDRTERIKKVASQAGVTLNVALQAFWGLLLAKYTGKNDVVYGEVLSGRPAEVPGIERMIGLFINTVPVRVSLANTTTMEHVMAALQVQIASSEKYQYLPLGEIQGLSALHQQLFDHILAFANYPLEEEEIGTLAPNEDIALKLGLDNIDSFEQTNFHFSVMIHTGQELKLEFIYNRNRFSEDSVYQIFSYFTNLIDGVLADIKKPLLSIPYLSAEEEKTLLYDFNNTSKPITSTGTMVNTFEKQVVLTPEAIAIIHNEHKVNYIQLNNMANQAAHYLEQKGVAEGVRVAVICPSNVNTIASMLGIMKCGAIYMPVDPSSPENRIEYILKDSGAEIVVTDAEHLNHIPKESYLSRTIILIEDMQLDKDERYDDPHKNIQPEAAAYLIYTSGSTGKPKGVLVPHKGNVNMSLDQAKLFELTPNDKVLQFASLAFDASIYEIFMALYSGASMVIIDKAIVRDIKSFVSYINDNEVTVVTLPPTYLNLLSGCDFPTLKHIITAGEPAIIKDVAHWSGKLNYYNAYGPTECSVCASVNKVAGLVEGQKRVSIGKPISNIRCYVLNDRLEPVPMGWQGELCLAGVGLALGYYGNKDLTDQKFITSPYLKEERLYRTGDLVKWLPNGTLDFMGRVDDQVKIRGHRVELGEIEACLMQNKIVKNAVVHVTETSPKEVVAYVIAESEEIAINKEILRSYLMKFLPDYMIPAYIYLVSDFPLNNNGKVDFEKLALSRKGDFETNIIKNENLLSDKERVLYEVFRKYLNRSALSLTDNFFELGGDSIKALQMTADLRQAGYMLDVKSLYEKGNIASLSPLLQTAELSISPATSVDPFPLSPIQNWFFSGERESINYYNQSIVLDANERLDIDAVRQAVRDLSIHHEMLKTQFFKTDQGWRQQVLSNNKVNLIVYDLSEETSPLEKRDSIIKSMQQLMRPEKAELIQTAIFNFQDKDQLFIALHHLVVDTYSWRIIHEDLVRFYESYKKGEKPKIPVLTNSYYQWVIALHNYSNSTELLKEKLFWNEAEEGVVEHIPGKSIEQDLVGEAMEISLVLSLKETEMLQSQVPKLMNCEINDILLTALGMAINESFDLDHISILLEGHGRENELGLDVSRTVGWFTSMYPLVFQFNKSDSVLVQVQKVKETRGKIPHKGLGYGVLKQRNKSSLKNPAIAFNYLGELDNSAESEILKMAGDYTPEDIDPRDRRYNELEVSGAITGGMMKLSLGYNPRRHTEKCMSQLLKGFENGLKKIIKSTATNGLSDVLHNEQPQVYPIDAFGLSPVQEALFNYKSSYPDSEAYVQQMLLQFDGKVDELSIRKTLDYLVERHEMLRTIFYQNYQGQPVQAVLPPHSINYRMMVAQTGLSQGINEVVSSDRAQGFDFKQQAPVRFTLLRGFMSEDMLLITFHHILMDGWCIHIILDELTEIYNSFINHQKLELGAKTSYKKFIKWLNQINHQLSLEYWSEYMKGYHHQELIPRKQRRNEGDDYDAVSLELSLNQTQMLQEFAQDHQITLSHLLMSIWAKVISSVSKQQDVLFGTVVSGRPMNLEGALQTIGLFINVVPLRFESIKETELSELSMNTKRHFLDSQTHEYVAVDQLLLQYNINIDHVVVVQNYPRKSVKDTVKNTKNDNYISVKDVSFYGQTAHDVSVEFFLDNQLELYIAFNKKAVAKRTIKTIVKSFEQLVRQEVVELYTEKQLKNE